MLLRETILSSKSKPLSENLKINSILHGTTNVPPKSSQFFRHLIRGPNSRRWKSDAKQHLIQSISQNVIFAALSGCKLPIKHLKPDVALKSLTGSRKVVKILNRYGNCANYHAIEEIET